MQFFYGSETKAERVKLQLGCPLLLLLLLLLFKRTSAKSYRAVSKKKKKKKYARIVFICSPVAAVDVDVDVAVAVSVDVLVVAATETNRLTVPASGLATHTQTHAGTHRQRETAKAKKHSGWRKETIGSTPDQADRSVSLCRPLCLPLRRESRDFRR